MVELGIGTCFGWNDEGKTLGKCEMAMASRAWGTEARKGVLLLVGGSDRPEFRSVVDSCERIAHPRFLEIRRICVSWCGRASTDRMEAAILDELSTCLDSGESGVLCPVLFLFESRPGEYSRQMVERIRRSFPILRFLLVAGTACEGEMRTGDVPSGVVRYYWHEWAGQGVREFCRFLDSEPSRLSLPLTVQEEDYYSWRQPGLVANGVVGDGSGVGDVAEATARILPFAEVGGEEPLFRNCCVMSCDQSMRILLHDMAAMRFDQVSSVPNLDGLLEFYCSDPRRMCRFVLDCTESDPRSLVPYIEFLSEKYPQAGFDLLLFSPRIGEVGVLEGTGADVSVVSKPFDATVLLGHWALREG